MDVMSVCVSVSLLVYLKNQLLRLHKMFCMMHVAMAWSSSMVHSVMYLQFCWLCHACR